MKKFQIIAGSHTAHTAEACFYLKRATAEIRVVEATRLPKGCQWCEECERLHKLAKA